jgi:hypothetical protein
MSEPLPGLDFLRDYEATRAGGYGESPDLYGPSVMPDPDDEPDADATPRRDRDYEGRPWEPIPVGEAIAQRDPSLRPERFVDGKDSGRVIAYILSPQGIPVPLRLAQVGAVALRAVPATSAGTDGLPFGLRVESRQTARVVSFMADLFPWDAVERFAAALQANGFRMLISRRATPEDDMRNLPWLERNGRAATSGEMFRYEREMARLPDALTGQAPVTLSDGRLKDLDTAVMGLGIIKSHSDTSFLDDRGWDTLYALRAGERTPTIFSRAANGQEIITWYARIAARGRHPMDGIVRVEMTRTAFEGPVQNDFTYLDYISRCLCRWRTRDQSYSRASVTLEPIRRAEELLGAAFCEREGLINRFYRMTGL